jgi:hypothetical protein
VFIKHKKRALRELQPGMQLRMRHSITIAVDDFSKAIELNRMGEALDLRHRNDIPATDITFVTLCPFIKRYEKDTVIHCVYI